MIPNETSLNSSYKDYLTEDGYQRLRSYLGRIDEGSNKDWRTPFYDKANREEILSSWESHLESIKDKFPSLWDFENDLRAKVGPLSIMKPFKDRVKDVVDYYDCSDKPAEPINLEAISVTQREFNRARGLRLKGQMTTVNDMKKSTNSGVPFFTKRRLVVNETVPISHTYATEQYLAARLAYKPAAVVGWRGQEGGPTDEDVKQRVIWMFPFGYNIEELRAYQPLIQAFQRMNLVSPWVSMDAVDSRMTSLFDSVEPGQLIVCTDFTKFDQHFNGSMQDAAYTMLKYLFDPSPEFTNWLTDVFPVKYDIPIIVPGVIYSGSHGMASGSGGTNADETLAHRCLQHEAALKQGVSLNPFSQCLGDDGVLSFKGINAEKVTSSYTKHGLEMNPSKQYEDAETATFLRRWYNKNYRIDGICRGVYSTFRAIGRLAGQERFYDPAIWTPEMVELRWLSIIENVKWHPLREEFAQWCMKGDKYALGTKLPGFFDKIVNYAKDAIEYMPDFLGYTRSLQQNNDNPSGIKDWWIVKYLKSLV